MAQDTNSKLKWPSVLCSKEVHDPVVREEIPQAIELQQVFHLDLLDNIVQAVQVQDPMGLVYTRNSNKRQD